VTPIAPVVDKGHVMGLLSEGIETQSNFLISVFDYGGQQVFDIIHNLFLTEYGIYALCFDCSWLLKDASEDVQKNCLQYLHKWLNSIVLHTFDIDTKRTAPVVLIGTHCDVVSDPGDHHRISELLNDYFLSNPAWKFKIDNEEGIGRGGAQSNLCFFPVDNTKGRKNDPTFKVMMQKN
jgi:GTPase SAR1 family protein